MPGLYVAAADENLGPHVCSGRYFTNQAPLPGISLFTTVGHQGSLGARFPRFKFNVIVGKSQNMSLLSGGTPVGGWGPQEAQRGTQPETHRP